MAKSKNERIKELEQDVHQLRMMLIDLKKELYEIKKNKHEYFG